MEDWTLTAARNVLKLARMGAPARSRLANTARREGRRATAAGLLHGVRACRAARWAGCRGAGPAGAHRPAPAGRAGVPGWDGETGCPAERPGRPRAARPGAARCGDRTAGGGAQPLIDDVERLAITYLDAEGRPTRVPGEIRSVLVAVTTGPQKAGTGAVTMTTQVRFRNR